MLQKTVNKQSPVLTGVIPEYRARIEGITHPWTLPTLCIRKPPEKVLDLKDYVNNSRMNEAQYSFIQQCIKEKFNVIIAGGTGSGKTTLLNAILKELAFLCPDDRLYTVEDTLELQITSKDCVPICVEPHLTIKAVRSALRFYPDRIIFGELRYGDTTHELLKAWNTGHPGGWATLHANSSETVICRLKNLIEEVIPGRIKESSIAETINAIIFIKDSGNGPVVDTVTKVTVDSQLDKILYTHI